MRRKRTFAKARCIEVECPHWGWIKVPFDDVDKNWWSDCYIHELELTFICPACGEEHEISNAVR